MWVEALTPTGSVLHAGNADRRKSDGYHINMPVACHAGMSRRFDVERPFDGESPLYCKDCLRILRKEPME